MTKPLKLKRIPLGKGFYYHKTGNYMRQTLKKYDESKLSGYRYKKVKNGEMILMGIVKDKFVRKDNCNTYEEALEVGLQEALKLIK